jgi:hypothetical protein
MGLLSAFVEGASGEYLDQRKDDRTNKFQEIRDKRLSELKKGESKHEFGLRADENTVQYDRSVKRDDTLNKRQSEAADTLHTRNIERDDTLNTRQVAAAALSEENAAKKPKILSSGQEIRGPNIDTETGELEILGKNKPAPSAVHNKALREWDKWDKTNITLTNGKRLTTDKLYKEWLTQAYGDPAFPEAMTTVKRPGVLDWIPYHNSRVVTKDRATFGDPEAKLNDARENMPDFANRKNEMVLRLKKNYPWWTPPEWAIGADLGAGSGDHPSGRKPDADLGAGSGEHPRGGLLAEAANTVEDTSRNAGIGSGGEPSVNGEISTQQSSGDVFSGHIQDKLTEMEAQLANMPDFGRGAGKRKALEDQIKRQRRLLEESGGNG